MCGMAGGGGDEKKDDKLTLAPTPALSQTAEAMIAALSGGPGSYSTDILRNLGMNAPNPGYHGGERPTSGMTRAPVPGGYQPVTPTAQPASNPYPDRGQPSSVSEADLFLSRKLPREAPGSKAGGSTSGVGYGSGDGGNPSLWGGR